MAGVNRTVEFYGLSTCGWCRKTKQWLDEHGVEYKLVYVDLAQGDEKEQAQKRMALFVDRQSFPTLIIDDGKRVIQGYQVDEMQEELG